MEHSPGIPARIKVVQQTKEDIGLPDYFIGKVFIYDPTIDMYTADESTQMISRQMVEHFPESFEQA